MRDRAVSVSSGGTSFYGWTVLGAACLHRHHGHGHARRPRRVPGAKGSGPGLEPLEPSAGVGAPQLGRDGPRRRAPAAPIRPDRHPRGGRRRRRPLLGLGWCCRARSRRCGSSRSRSGSCRLRRRRFLRAAHVDGDQVVRPGGGWRRAWCPPASASVSWPSPRSPARYDQWDWRMALLVLGDLAWLIVVPVALVIREQPGDVGAGAMGDRPGRPRVLDARGAGRAAVLGHRAHALRLLRRPLRADLPHGHPRHRPGHGAMAAAACWASPGCRPSSGDRDGLLADRVGAKRTLLAGLALQAAMIASTCSCRTWCLLRAGHRLRGRLGGLHAALRPGHPRVLRRAGHGHRLRGVFFISCSAWGSARSPAGCCTTPSAPTCGCSWARSPSAPAIVLAVTLRPPAPPPVARVTGSATPTRIPLSPPPSCAKKVSSLYKNQPM